MVDSRRPIDCLRYYAKLLVEESFEKERPSFTGERRTLVRRLPLGVAAAIVPWNYPQTLAVYKYAPSLAAGCTAVLKPSPETVLDAVLLAEAVDEAEVPARSVQHRAGRPRDRRVPRLPPERQSSGLHRFDRWRSVRRAAGCFAPSLWNWWQVCRHHPR